MANLNGQNIGLNYKGFLNLDSTINTPLDTTLRSVTDGMGTASSFYISTTKQKYDNGTTQVQYENANVFYGYNSTMVFNYMTYGFGGYNTPYFDAQGFVYRCYTGTGFVIGGSSNPANATSSRLLVRGDGTNPIARFEASSGNNHFAVYESYYQFGTGNNLFQVVDGDASTSINGLSVRFRSGLTTQNGSVF